MPKLRKSPDQQANSLIKATICKYQVIRNVSTEQIAASASICARTLARRMKNPETFNLGELRKIIRSLQIPAGEIESPIVGIAAAAARGQA